MYFLAAILSLVGICWAPFGIHQNYDPGYYFFNYLLHPIDHQSWAIKTVTIIIRFVTTQWSVMECCRSQAIILIASMSYCNMIIKCLRGISRIPLSEKTVQEYMKLRYVSQIGKESAQNLAGILMGVGFVICICGNWVSIFGWRFIPFEVNIAMCLITVVVYLCIHETLPRAIKCHEYSKMLVKTWDYKYMKLQIQSGKCTANSNNMYIKSWRKTCKAQQPITLYFFTTKFKRETNVNFYSNIVNYTVDMLLSTSVINTK